MSLHRAARPRRVRPLLSALLAVLFIAPVLLASRAEAATTVFYVNSLSTGVNGNACTTDTLSGNCSLRTALTNANAVAGTDPVVVQLATGFAGGVIDQAGCPLTNFMAPVINAVGNATAAYYSLTRANTTIDLGNKLGLKDNDCTYALGLLVNAPNAVVRNVKDFYPGEVGFAVGPNGDDATFTGLDLVNTANYFPEQGIVVTGGATNVTITNSRMGGYYSGASTNNGDGIIGLARNGLLSDAITNVNVTNNTFIGGSTAAGAGCGTTSAVGCTARGIATGTNVTVNGLTVTGNTFTNFGSNSTAAATAFRGAIDLDSLVTGVSLSGLTVTSNTFTGSKPTVTSRSADITLPYLATLAGTNLIADNTFTAANDQQGSAISWIGGNAGAENTVASNLTIRDNAMSGYGFGLPAINLSRTGTVRVERTTFTATNAAVATDATSETGVGSVLMSNVDTTANRKIPTWFPSGTPTVTAGDSCTVAITANRPTTDAAKLTYPVSIDVYWSASTSTGAQRYLGRATVTDTATATVSVPFLANLPAGRLRFQTLTATSPAQSSQYSRVLAVPASTCPAARLTPSSGGSAGGTSVALRIYPQATGDGTTTSTATLTGVTFAGLAGTSLSGSGVDYTVVTPAYDPGATSAAVNVVLSFSDGSTRTITNGFTYIPDGKLAITKKAYSDAARTTQIPDLSVVDKGQTVYWLYTVQNTGQANLTNVAVTDNRLTPTTVCTIATLARGATTTCTASGAVN